MYNVELTGKVIICEDESNAKFWYEFIKEMELNMQKEKAKAEFEKEYERGMRELKESESK